MKIRNDFISNSSSCSFIVTDVIGAVRLFVKEFGKDVDWPYSIDDIHVSMTGSKECLEKLKTTVECGTISQLYGSTDAYELCDLDIAAVLSTPLNMLKGIRQMTVSTEDTNEGNVTIVRLLKAFFEKNGIEAVDCGDCDSSLDGNGIVLKLMRSIASSAT